MNEERSGNASIATENLPLVVGVDLGGTQMRTAMLRGTNLLSRVGLLTGENPTPERVLPRTMRAIEQALDQAHVSLDQIAGIGVAMPGPINSHTGVVYSPPNLPGWDNVPLRDIFSQQFNVPVFVENDANTAALGEYIFGAGRGTKNMVYMTISTGIGGGIIIGRAKNDAYPSDTQGIVCRKRVWYHHIYNEKGYLCQHKKSDWT